MGFEKFTEKSHAGRGGYRCESISTTNDAVLFTTEASVSSGIQVGDKVSVYIDRDSKVVALEKDAEGLFKIVSSTKGRNHPKLCSRPLARLIGRHVGLSPTLCGDGRIEFCYAERDANA